MVFLMIDRPVVMWHHHASDKVNVIVLLTIVVSDYQHLQTFMRANCGKGVCVLSVVRDEALQKTEREYNRDEPGLSTSITTAFR